MKTLTIEVTDPAAYQHLKELEDLHLIHVMEFATKPATFLSQNFAGKLPSVVADDLQQYIKRNRDN